MKKITAMTAVLALTASTAFAGAPTTVTDEPPMIPTDTSASSSLGGGILWLGLGAAVIAGVVASSSGSD